MIRFEISNLILLVTWSNSKNQRLFRTQLLAEQLETDQQSLV